MEPVLDDDRERERQRAGIAWALGDLDGLRARGVIDQAAYAALRDDFAARMLALDAPIVPSTGTELAAPPVPDRPPPAPLARGRPAAPPIAPGDIAGIDSPPAPAAIPAAGDSVSLDAPLVPVAPVAPPPAGVTGLWINLVLFLGAFFVVVAALIFVASQWASIGAVAKAGIMAGFTLGFIASGLACVRLPRVRPAGQTFLAIGAILLPLDVVGGYNVLFRDQGFSVATIWLLGALICALFYGALTLSGLGRPYAFATLLATISAWGGLIATLDVPRAWLGAALMPLPLLLLSAGRLSERTAFGKATFGALPTWAAHLLIPFAYALQPFTTYERRDVPGTATALGLVALFYAAAALSQPRQWLRAAHVAGIWLALATLVPLLGWGAAIPGRGYAALALGVAWLALLVGAGLRRADEAWHGGARVSYAAGWAHLLPLLLPWGFLIDDRPTYWALIFGGAAAYAAVNLWGFRQPLLLYPLGLAGVLAFYHVLAIGARPDGYGYVWAYTLASLVILAPLQPLRLAGASREWDRHLVAVSQLIALGAAVVAQQVGDPFQSAAVPVVALLASGVVVAIERRAELLFLPNLWGLVATAAVVRLAGAGERWAPACYAGVGLLLAIGLQAWRTTPAARRDVWYIAHRLSAGGWAIVGPVIALYNLAEPLSDFLNGLDLGPLVIASAYGPSGLAVALCGAALAADAVMTLRRPTGYSASAMIALAILMGIARITPDNPQAYALPLGVYLLALSIYVAYERDLGSARMPAANGLLSSAIVVMLGTTFLQSIARPWQYLLLGLVEGLILLSLTAFLRRRYGVALAVGFLTLTAFRAIFDVARALPNWATIGLLGLMLLGVGVLFLLRRDRLEAWGSAALQRWARLT